MVFRSHVTELSLSPFEFHKIVYLEGTAPVRDEEALYLFPFLLGICPVSSSLLLLNVLDTSIHAHSTFRSYCQDCL